MYKRITEYDFINALDSNFTRQGAGILYDWLLEYEDETGTQIEFDAVAIRCEWNESTKKELIDDYGYLLEEEDDDIIELIQDRTFIAGSYINDKEEDVYIYQAF